MILTPAAVRSRYDELAALITEVETLPTADPALVGEVTPQLVHEGRLLDTGRLEQWLETWTADAVLWVPLSGPAHPGRDQSLLLDDRRRLGERVNWLRDPSAWGQQPPSRTTRLICGVEAWQQPDRVVARSSLVVHEQRHRRHQQLAGYQIHEFVAESVAESVADRFRLRTKILILPALGVGVRNPSFLL